MYVCMYVSCDWFLRHRVFIELRSEQVVWGAQDD